MTHEDINQLIQIRIEKGVELRKSGVNPYSNGFRTTHTVSAARALCEGKTGEELESSPEEYSLAGRIMAINSFGKAIFLRIRDFTGQIQVFLKKDVLGEEVFQTVKRLDVGDFIGVRGRLFLTKTGELTLLAAGFHFLTKSVRPLPEKWHGLKDIETRHRQRYVDLVMNPEVKEIFRIRAEIIKYIRNFLDAKGYLEVETPMLHPVLGGANARPFRTHHNTLDMDLYLRIAPELYLKRLVVGGMDRVYEINKNFRNEGMSARHNPEFTMIEFYQAYATYEDLMALTEELLGGLVLKITGSHKIRKGETEIDFTPPFRRLGILDSLREYGGAREEDFASLENAREFAVRCG
ncbi:MAG: lysine--tRNA ligase, partial [Deltaproteobacteria bacterium]|nr:lysine--tRNA ligase [Deltaproteobacteria bacterium]